MPDDSPSSAGPGEKERISSPPTARWCRGQSSAEFRWLADRRAGRFGKLCSAEGGVAAANRFRQISLAGFLALQGLLEDFASFLFHGAAMVRGAYPQPRFRGFVQPANGDAGHRAMIAMIALLSLPALPLNDSRGSESARHFHFAAAWPPRISRCTPHT